MKDTGFQWFSEGKSVQWFIFCESAIVFSLPLTYVALVNFHWLLDLNSLYLNIWELSALCFSLIWVNYIFLVVSEKLPRKRKEVILHFKVFHQSTVANIFASYPCLPLNIKRDTNILYSPVLVCREHITVKDDLDSIKESGCSVPDFRCCLKLHLSFSLFFFCSHHPHLDPTV